MKDKPIVTCEYKGRNTNPFFIEKKLGMLHDCVDNRMFTKEELNKFGNTLDQMLSIASNRKPHEGIVLDMDADEERRGKSAMTIKY